MKYYTEKEFKFIARVLDDYMNACRQVMDDESATDEVKQVADWDLAYAWRIYSKIEDLLHE